MTILYKKMCKEFPDVSPKRIIEYIEHWGLGDRLWPVLMIIANARRVLTREIHFDTISEESRIPGEIELLNAIIDDAQALKRTLRKIYKQQKGARG